MNIMKTNKKILSRKRKEKELIYINIFINGIQTKTLDGFYVVNTDRKGRFIKYIGKKYHLNINNSIRLDIKTIKTL